MVLIANFMITLIHSYFEGNTYACIMSTTKLICILNVWLMSMQIVSIDGMDVKHLEHADVVKAFKSRDKVSLVILPARFKSVS